MKEFVCYGRSIIFAALTSLFILMCLLLTPASVVAEPGPNGIDFWANDRLHLPDYGASTNLILNPSFESGLKYWGYLCYAQSFIALSYSNFEAIDSNEAHSGSHSLRLKALSVKDPLPIGTFSIPFVKNASYVLSFYAKGSRSTGLRLNVWGRGAQTTQLFPSYTVAFTINNQWQRYSTTFTANDMFSAIYFDAQTTSGTQECAIWLDDVQLETGTVPTTFTQTPVAAQLVSAARGNFLQFGQSPNFNMVINTLANTTGTVALSVEDFFYNNVFTGTYQFATNSAGDSTIALDALSNAVSDSGLRGTFVVTGVFNVSGVSRTYTDYFRFSVMSFLDNTQKNKNLFNLNFVYQLQAGGGDFGRFLARYRALGFGSFTYDFLTFGADIDYGLDSERMQLAEQYGLSCVGRGVLQLGSDTISEGGGTYIMTGIKTKTNPSSMYLADFANICSIKSANRNYNDIWWFTGESNPGCEPLESVPDAFAKFLIATNQGIKAGNPNAKVLIEGGPWKLDAESTGWVERYIQDTKRINPNVNFDGASAHHYRNFPENPDLDADVAYFLAMLDRNGCSSWPFQINEGGNYLPFNIPELSMSPYVVQSGNSWYMGPVSYHSGRSERISAAFSARNWLVALKYQNRVTCMEDFMTPSRLTDADFTSRFYEKIPNTLGRLLGNASFVQDIPFAPNCRGYLFRDDTTSCPIAVVWGYKTAVDQWQEEPPKYTFDFGSLNVTFIDLMENAVTFPKDCSGRFVIPITSFPLFIRSTPGTDSQLVSALSNYGYSGLSPVIYMDGIFHNGAFEATTYGYWYNTPDSIPTGWVETAQYMYTTATRWVQAGSTAEAINNTGERVSTGQVFTVSADLGGGDGTDATVRVYATQYANGTGTKVLLASVHRVNSAGQGYTLYHVDGSPGTTASSSINGYYVQVKLSGPYSDYGHYLSGYYDNIVVTALTNVTAVCCGDTNHPYPAGDLNQDCYVNWKDIDKFVDQWLVSCAGPGWCSGANLSKDADVNLNDLAVIGANWLSCTDPNQPCSYNP